MSFKSGGPRIRPERMKPPPSQPSVPSPSLSDIKDDEGQEPLFPPSWSNKSTTENEVRPSQSTSDARRDSIASRSSSSSTASFYSAHFPVDEESQMIESSNTIKAAANRQFAAGDFSSAIGTYDRAAAELPSYLDYEMAVLQSNIAICHLRLEQWREAMDAAERGIKGLERVLPIGKSPQEKKAAAETGAQKTSATVGKQTVGLTSAVQKGSKDLEEDRFVELPDDVTENKVSEDTFLAQLALSDERKLSIHRIRTKLFLRRARAKSSMEPASWGNLAGALEDYNLLSSPEYYSHMPTSDQKTVRQMLDELPARVEEAKKRDVGEMMDKLKELGNGILRPFGLNTNMFKMNQDPATGGYSMSFEQGR